MKFSIDAGTYTVAGLELIKVLLQLQLTHQLHQVWSLLTPRCYPCLIGLAISIFFIVKGIRGGIILSIAATTVVGILIGVVDLGSVNWAATNLSASINDLKEIFGVALGSQGLGSLFSDASRIPGVLMAILAFSLTDIFDTIGTLVGTGEKVGIVASTGEKKNLNHLTVPFILIWLVQH